MAFFEQSKNGLTPLYQVSNDKGKVTFFFLYILYDIYKKVQVEQNKRVKLSKFE